MSKEKMINVSEVSAVCKSKGVTLDVQSFLYMVPNVPTVIEVELSQMYEYLESGMFVDEEYDIFKAVLDEI